VPDFRTETTEQSPALPPHNLRKKKTTCRRGRWRYNCHRLCRRGRRRYNCLRLCRRGRRRYEVVLPVTFGGQDGFANGVATGGVLLRNLFVVPKALRCTSWDPVEPGWLSFPVEGCLEQGWNPGRACSAAIPCLTRIRKGFILNRLEIGCVPSSITGFLPGGMSHGAFHGWTIGSGFPARRNIGIGNAPAGGISWKRFSAGGIFSQGVLPAGCRDRLGRVCQEKNRHCR